MPQVTIPFVVKQIIIWVALTAATYVLRPKPKTFRQSAGNSLRTNRGTIMPWRVIYGKVRVGGTVVMRHFDGSHMWEVIAIAAHEINDITTLYNNDKLWGYGFSWSGNHGTSTTPPFDTFEVWKYLGTDSQTYNTQLSAATDIGGGPTWTSAHRLRGIAYVVIKMPAAAEVWPDGAPNWSFVVEGKKDIFDPRTDTTAYTDNAALCLADYLYNSRFGLGAGTLTTEYSDIDDADLVAAANTCEELVQITAGPDTFQERYTVNGFFDVDGTHEGTVEQFLNAMGAGSTCYWSQGKWHIIPGSNISSSGTITEDDLAGPIQVQPRVSKSELFNAIKGTYLNQQEEYLPDDYPIVKNATYETEDGEQIIQGIDYIFITDPLRSQRVSKTYLEDARQQIIVNLECKLGCYKYQPGDRVALTLNRYGWSSKLFRIIETGISVDGGDTDNAPRLFVKMTLKETATTIWDWNLGEETTVDPAPDTELPDWTTISPPTNLNLTELIRTDNNGIQTAEIQATWTNPTDAPHHLYTELQYRYDDVTPYWHVMRIDKSETQATVAPAVLGALYRVQVRTVSIDGVVSTWATDSLQVSDADHGLPDDDQPVNMLYGGDFNSPRDWRFDKGTPTRFEPVSTPLGFPPEATVQFTNPTNATDGDVGTAATGNIGGITVRPGDEYEFPAGTKTGYVQVTADCASGFLCRMMMEFSTDDGVSWIPMTSINFKSGSKVEVYGSLLVGQDMSKLRVKVWGTSASTRGGGVASCWDVVFMEIPAGVYSNVTNGTAYLRGDGVSTKGFLHRPFPGLRPETNETTFLQDSDNVSQLRVKCPDGTPSHDLEVVLKDGEDGQEWLMQTIDKDDITTDWQDFAELFNPASDVVGDLEYFIRTLSTNLIIVDKGMVSRGRVPWGWVPHVGEQSLGYHGDAGTGLRDGYPGGFWPVSGRKKSDITGARK